MPTWPEIQQPGVPTRRLALRDAIVWPAPGPIEDGLWSGRGWAMGLDIAGWLPLPGGGDSGGGRPERLSDVLIYPGGTTAYLVEHRAALDAALATHASDPRVPPPGAAGLGCVEPGAVMVPWDRVTAEHAAEAADWRAAIDTHRPSLVAGLEGAAKEAVYRDQFEALASEILRATLDHLRTRRPGVAWSLAGSPWTPVGALASDGASVRAANDRIASVCLSACDWLAPMGVLALASSSANATPGAVVDPPVRAIAAEARRVALLLSGGSAAAAREVHLLARTETTGAGGGALHAAAWDRYAEAAHAEMAAGLLVIDTPSAPQRADVAQRVRRFLWPACSRYAAARQWPPAPASLPDPAAPQAWRDATGGRVVFASWRPTAGNTGLTHLSPVSLTEALAQMRDNQPDWIMLEAGDYEDFTATDLPVWSGRSPTRPGGYMGHNLVGGGTAVCSIAMGTQRAMVGIARDATSFFVVENVELRCTPLVINEQADKLEGVRLLDAGTHVAFDQVQIAGPHNGISLVPLGGGMWSDIAVRATVRDLPGRGRIGIFLPAREVLVLDSAVDGLYTGDTIDSNTHTLSHGIRLDACLTVPGGRDRGGGVIAGCLAHNAGQSGITLRAAPVIVESCVSVRSAGCYGLGGDEPANAYAGTITLRSCVATRSRNGLTGDGQSTGAVGLGNAIAIDHFTGTASVEGCAALLATAGTQQRAVVCRSGFTGTLRVRQLHVADWDVTLPGDWSEHPTIQIAGPCAYDGQDLTILGARTRSVIQIQSGQSVSARRTRIASTGAVGTDGSARMTMEFTAWRSPDAFWYTRQEWDALTGDSLTYDRLTDQGVRVDWIELAAIHLAGRASAQELIRRIVEDGVPPPGATGTDRWHRPAELARRLIDAAAPWSTPRTQAREAAAAARWDELAVTGRPAQAAGYNARPVQAVCASATAVDAPAVATLAASAIATAPAGRTPVAIVATSAAINTGATPQHAMAAIAIGRLVAPQCLWALRATGSTPADITTTAGGRVPWWCLVDAIVSDLPDAFGFVDAAPATPAAHAARQATGAAARWPLSGVDLPPHATQRGLVPVIVRTSGLHAPPAGGAYDGNAGARALRDVHSAVRAQGPGGTYAAAGGTWAALSRALLAFAPRAGIWTAAAAGMALLGGWARRRMRR